MNTKELMIAIETGLKNLYNFSSQAADYYSSIVYDQDKLIADNCTEEILTQIEDDVMQFTIEE